MTAARSTLSRALLVSVGSALLAVAPDGASQQFSRWTTSCDGVYRAAGIALGDVDADGDLDIVYANGRHFAEPDWVYTNDGRGMFGGRRAFENQPDPSYGVALGDVDGDKDLDAVVANDTGSGSVVYQNDGRGTFTVRATLGPPAPRRAVALGDLDGDGDLDVVLVGVGQDHIFLNEDRGRRWTARPLGSRAGNTARATGVAVTDVDGDRDLDIVVPGRYEEPSLIHINDGKGGFSEARPFGDAADDPTSVAVGDVDGDGDVDIVTGEWQKPHVVYANDGKGRFSVAFHFGSGKEFTWSMLLADIDLDGDVDAVAGNANMAFWGEDLDGDKAPDRFGGARGDLPSRVYLNDGRGRFTPGEPISAGSDNTRPLAAGDVDGDGDIDIVMGNDCQQNHLFLNQLRTPSR